MTGGGGPRIGIDARMAGHSGIGRYIRNLMTGLAALEGPERYAVILNPDRPDTGFPSGEGWEILRSPRTVPIYSFREQFGWPAWLARQRLDLLHVPHYNAPARCPVPLVATIHDLIHLHFPEEGKSRLHVRAAAWLLRKVSSHARRLIAVSEATRKDLIATLGADASRVAVVHHGRGLDPSGPPVPVRPAALDGDGPFLLSVGNHHPHKNLGMLLAASAEARKEVPSIRLVLAGRPGRFTDDLRKEAERLGLGDGAIWLTDLDDAGIAWLYGNARAVVIPSKMEGFGFPVLEAFDAGTPVVSSSAAALAETAGGAAMLIDADDAAAWTRGLLRIWTDDALRKELAALGLDRAAAFDWARTAERTRSVYREVLAS